MKKRFLSFALAVLMLVTMAPITALGAEGYLWPVPYASKSNVSQPYGGSHYGIDIARSGIYGQSVVATKSGTIFEVYSGCIAHSRKGCGSCSPSTGKSGGSVCNYGYGNGIVIAHDDGTWSCYAHLSAISITKGQHVAQGTVIGKVGDSGDASGAHLHFEIGTNVCNRGSRTLGNGTNYYAVRNSSVNYSINTNPSALTYIYGDAPPVDPSDPVSFSGLSTKSAADTNAVVSFNVSVSGGISYQVGLEVEGVKTYVYPKTFTAAYVPSTYDLSSECGIVLQPDTDYRWRALVKTSEKTYYSDYVPFKTTGTPAAPIEVRFDQFKSRSSTQTNAVFTCGITKTGGTCTALKFELYDGNTGKLIDDFVAGASLGPAVTSFDFTVDVQQDMGRTLTPGTAYSAVFYAYVDGQWYGSNGVGISTKPDVVSFDLYGQQISLDYVDGVRTYEEDSIMFNVVPHQDGCVFNRAGALLYNSSGELIKDCYYDFGDYTNDRMIYQIVVTFSHYGVTLSGGTLYYIQPYMTIEGQTKYGNYTTLYIPAAPTPYERVGRSYTHAYETVLDANGGVCTAEAMLVFANDPIGHLPTPTRKGFDFVGWSTEKAGWVIITEQNMDEDIGDFGEDTGYTEMLYAIWIEHEYDITYWLNGGSGNANNPVSYNIYTPATELLPPTKDGCVFAGWFADPGCSVPFTSVGGGMVGDVTVYAKWTAAAHTHSYTAAVTKPTCTDKGYTTHTCSCGDSYVDSYVPALGHNFVAGRCTRCQAVDPNYQPSHEHSYTASVTRPTCTEKGFTTYTCFCGDSYKTDYVAALGHNYVGGACTRCGTDDPGYKPAHIHSFVNGKCTVCGVLSPEPAKFVDVAKGVNYYDAVLWAANKGVTSGYTATEFKPGNPCTRGQVVTFLWRAAGCPEPSGSNPFVDVENSGSCKPYYKAIVWAAEQGITTGLDATHFAPNATVTRAQFVTFLWRYEGKPASNGTINGFADAAKIAAPFQPAVAWAVEKGITTGYGDGTFRPTDTCTRWAVVLFMYRDLA